MQINDTVMITTHTVKITRSLIVVSELESFSIAERSQKNWSRILSPQKER